MDMLPVGLLKIYEMNGMTLHAAVRNPNKNRKIAHLKEAAVNSEGTIEFFYRRFNETRII